MRHRVAGKHLGRSVGQRNALRRTLITQLFTHERIKTTRAKAEAIQAEAEKMITKAKQSLADGNRAVEVHARRTLAGRLDGSEAVKKVFEELAPRYADRKGGYTRVYHIGIRKGDAAEMVLIELVDRPNDDVKPAPATGNIVQRAGGLFGRIRGNRGAQTTESQSGEGQQN